MMLKNTIGILGGTFNPVHRGHLQLALAAIKYMQLQQIQLMPCAVPPHKKTSKVLPFSLRVHLLKTAIQNIPELSINTLESRLPSPSYTWNTLKAWKNIYPNYQPLFILSCEEFSVLNKWYKGVDLPNLAHFLVVPRDNSRHDSYVEALKNIWGCTTIKTVKSQKNILYASPLKKYYCFFLPITVTNVRSKVIRKLWNKGLHLNNMLQEPIVKILQNNTSLLQEFWYS